MSVLCPKKLNANEKKCFKTESIRHKDILSPLEEHDGKFK